MASWRPYSEEERAARRAADRALRERADAFLATDDAAGALAALAALDGPIAGYSDGNKALLWLQASDRGITLTDVDDAAGWRARGRLIAKNARGMRIAKPRDTSSPGQRYRMVSRFDISQTVEIPACPVSHRAAATS